MVSSVSVSSFRSADNGKDEPSRNAVGACMLRGSLWDLGAGPAGRLSMTARKIRSVPGGGAYQ